MRSKVSFRMRIAVQVLVSVIIICALCCSCTELTDLVTAVAGAAGALPDDAIVKETEPEQIMPTEAPVKEEPTPLPIIPFADRMAIGEYKALSEAYRWDDDPGIFTSTIYPDITDVELWPEYLPKSLLLDYVYNAYSSTTKVDMQPSRELDLSDEQVAALIAAAREMVYFTQGGDWKNLDAEEARMRELLPPSETLEQDFEGKREIYQSGELVIETAFVSDKALVYRDSGNLPRVRGIMFCKCTHFNGDSDVLLIEPDKLYYSIVEFVIAPPDAAAAYYDMELWSNEPYYVIFNIGFTDWLEATETEAAIYRQAA